uniref:Replication factor A C-terminal domain-containing protein n=1 Tax=Lotus japonicus TaxID=34305 RepID=I3S126_LOTJA|nr:unknown [Lotus japonicus]
MALFGNYVDVLKGFLATDGVGLAVIVVQLAKVKTYRGEVVIQNVMHATKLLWNAEIPEVAAFRDGLALHGLDADIPIGQIGGGFHNMPANEEFITMFPRKNIVELHDTAEEGLFLILAEISGLVDGEKWWYTSCRCRRSVTIEDGIYFCASCSTHVIDVTPRFRIKFEVSDGDEVATFAIFDTDCENMLKKSCRELVLGSKGKSVEEYPDEIKALIGKEAIFKVEKSIDHGMKYDDSYKVKKICDDLSIIQLFKDKTKIQTPTTLITDPFCSKSASDDQESVFSDKSIGSSSQISAVPESTLS